MPSIIMPLSTDFGGESGAGAASLSSFVSASSTVTVNSDATALPTTTAGGATETWARHRCPWVGWSVCVPPTWTHERTTFFHGYRVVTVLRSDGNNKNNNNVAVHVTSTRIAPQRRFDVDEEKVFSDIVKSVERLPGLESCRILDDKRHVQYVVNNPESSCRLEGLRFRHSLHIIDVVFCAPEEIYLKYGPLGNAVLNSFEVPQ
eukprot:PhM_4_TR13935/c0_g1_i12/m.43591